MDLHPVSHPIWPLLWCWGGLTLSSCQSVTPLAQIPLTVDVVGCVERHIQAGGIECEINPGQHLTLMVHTEHPRPLQMVVGFEDRKGRRQVIAEGIRFETKTLWQGELPPDLPLAQGQLKVVVWEGALPPGIKGTPWIQWQPQWTPEGWNQAATVTPPLVSRVPVSSPAASCLNAPLTTPDPEVLSACRNAVETWPTAGDPLAQGHVLNHLAFQTYFVGAGGDQTATAQALALFEELYKLSKDNGFLKLQLDALRGRGQILLGRYRAGVSAPGALVPPEAQQAYEEVTRLFREGVSLAQQQGDRSDQAQMFRKSAQALVLEPDRYAEAITHLSRALLRFMEMGEEENAARVLISLLSLDSEQGHPELGLERMEPLRSWVEGQLRSETPGPIALGIHHWEGVLRAQLYSQNPREGSLQALEDNYLTTLEKYPPTGDSAASAIRLVEELILAALAADNIQAAERLRQAGTHLLPGWDGVSYHMISLELAITRGDRARYEQLKSELNHLLVDVGDLDRSWRMSFLDAQWALKQGRPEQAWSYLERAMEVMEELTLNLYSSGDQVQAAGHFDREEVFHLAERVALEMGRPRDALITAERNRTLQDYQQELVAAIFRFRQEHPDVWEVDRQDYLKHHATVQVPTDNAPLAELEFGEALAELRRVERQLEKKWWEGSLKAKNSGETGSFTPIPPGEGVVEFSLAGDDLVAYGLVGGDVEVVKTGLKRWDLAPCVLSLRQHLAPKVLGTATPAAGACETKLSQALDRAIPTGTRRLTVIPFGPLMDLPFHAITLQEKVLAEGMEVVQLPGLASYHPGGSGTVPAEVVTITNPTLDLGLTEDEGRVVQSSLARSVVLQRGEATLARVLEELPRAELIHYAGHGFQRGMNLRETWPVLADRQLLTPFDFLLQPLAARVVVLSACESGAGDPAGGGNRRGLVSTLLSAGTETVLATSWPIRSGDALPLMRDFYARWPRQEQQFSTAWAETIRRAVRGELGPRSQSPEVWASFVVWGR